jgi:hypothetical protein
VEIAGNRVIAGQSLHAALEKVDTAGIEMLPPLR